MSERDAAATPGRPKRVLITDALRGPARAIVRSLALDGFRSLAADEALPLGRAWSRFTGWYRELPPLEDERYIDALLTEARRARADVVLPFDTMPVGAVSRAERRFAGIAAVNVPPPEAFGTAVDKLTTIRQLDSLGIPAPAVFTPDEAERFLAGSPALSQPRAVVVKPRLEIGGARGVAYCQRSSEVQAAVRACEESYGPAVLQEYVPGGASAMRAVTLLFDTGGVLAGYFTLRKLRQLPPSGGVTVLAVSTDEHELVVSVLPFFRALGWRGPAEVEFKVDPRDGIARVIEVNPRFPSYIGFPVRCGCPLPSMAVEAALGRRDWPALEYRTGVRFISPLPYFQSALASYRAGTSHVRPRDLLQPFRGTIVGGAFDPTDPVPHLLQSSQAWIARIRGGR